MVKFVYSMHTNNVDFQVAMTTFLSRVAVEGGSVHGT